MLNLTKYLGFDEKQAALQVASAAFFGLGVIYLGYLVGKIFSQTI
jgi:hypothetical protein